MGKEKRAEIRKLLIFTWTAGVLYIWVNEESTTVIA